VPIAQREAVRVALSQPKPGGARHASSLTAPTLSALVPAGQGVHATPAAASYGAALARKDSSGQGVAGVVPSTAPGAAA
jgi:hypothetical protein